MTTPSTNSLAPVLADTLPSWYDVSALPAHPAWKTRVLSEPHLLHLAIGLFEDEAERAVLGGNPGHLYTTARAILTDISPVEPVAEATSGAGVGDTGFTSHSRNLLRFVAAAAALDLALHQGRSSDAYDWMLCALDDRPFKPIPIAEPTEVADWAWCLIDLMNNTHDLLQLELLNAFLNWAQGTYYTGWKFGAPQEALLQAAPLVVDVLGRALELERFQLPTASALGMVASWAQGYGAEHIVQSAVITLDRAIAGGKLVPEAATHAKLTLTTQLGERTGTAPQARAEQLLADGLPLTPFQRISALTASGRAQSKDGSPSPALLEAIEAHVVASRTVTQDDLIAFARLQASRYDDLLSLTVRFSSIGRSADAEQLTGRWFGARAPLRGGAVLQCSPSDARGVVYAIDGDVWIFPRAEDEGEVIRKMNAASDHALSTSTTFQQDLRSGNPAVNPMAFIRGEGVEAFEEELRSFYALDRVRAEIDPALLRGAGLFMSHVFRHPVQALLLEAFGETCPFIASFEEPAPDRVIRRALVWTSGVLLGPFEADAVASILRSGGIEVDALVSHDLTAGDLLRLYEDPRYDLLWLVGHGHFDGTRPEQAAIQLSGDPENVVTLPELIRVPVPGDQRRLLVLNLCESGIAMQAAVPARIGIGPLLADRNQAVAGHLWAVRNEPSGYFGAVMAEALAQGQGFFAAFARGLAGLRMSSGEAAARLEGIGLAAADLARLLRGAGGEDYDRRGVLTWGSPVFYE
jgi:hypothetical protein